jgi:predicted ATP-dependent endonuclease of OLD family
MKLKKLTLANFRGFDQIDLEFEEDLTVIAGVNGVGKSGVLQALAALLSHALPQFCVCLEKPTNLVGNDIQLSKAALSISCSLDLGNAALSASILRSAPIDLDEVKVLGEQRDELRKRIRYTAKKSKEAIEIEDQIKRIEQRLANPTDLPTVTLFPANNVGVDFYTMTTAAAASQPIAVLYSTSRLLKHVGLKLPPVTNVFLSSAYINALSQTEVSLYEFANWFRAVSEGAIQMPARAEVFLKLVESTLTALLPEMSELQLHTDGQPQFSLKKGTKRLYLWQLSDGEQGLIALALDLLRRLAIANPFVENPVETGSGIVLIDEIELHLHPSWQRRVIRSLQSVFKQCQFVVTTHSPQVIGQVLPSKLRLLHTDESGKVIQTSVAQSFGMDSSWVLQNVMGVPARDYETEQRLSAIYQSIDADRFDEARALAESLRAEIGDFPDLQEAIALLDRFALLRAQ